MKQVYGKNVFDSIEEMTAPQHTALVVIDMQNDYGHPEGKFASSGKDVANIADAVPGIQELVESARTAGVLVTWLKNTALVNGRSDSPAWLAFKAQIGNDPICTIEGTWGQEILDPLRPKQDEPVIIKHRSSGFFQTPLDLVLRSNGVETVVLCGCVTEGCVASTARDASFYNYYTLVVEDCVASTHPDLHEATLLVLGSRYTMVKKTTCTQLWRS